MELKETKSLDSTEGENQKKSTILYCSNPAEIDNNVLRSANKNF